MFQHDVNAWFLDTVLGTLLTGFAAGWPALVILLWGRRPAGLWVLICFGLALLLFALIGTTWYLYAAPPLGSKLQGYETFGGLLIGWSLYWLALARLRRHGAGAPAAET